MVKGVLSQVPESEPGAPGDVVGLEYLIASRHRRDEGLFETKLPCVSREKQPQILRFAQDDTGSV